MAKKVFTVVLIGCFFSFITPGFAATPEEEAENDKSQQRAVLAAIGIVALVGAIFMITRIDKSFVPMKTFSSGQKDKNGPISIGLDFANSGPVTASWTEERGWSTPQLKVVYSW